MTVDTEIGFGIVVKIGANAAATSATVTLGGLTEVAVPEFTRDSVEITAHDSPGLIREFIPGLGENGEVTWTLNWLPNNAADIEIDEWRAERTGRLVQVSFPMRATAGKIRGYEFRAFLTGKGPVTPMDDKMTCSITLRPVGVVTAVELDA